MIDKTTSKTPKSATGKAHPRGGAPFGNRNAMRHGLRAGSLPKGASYIAREMVALRREIEDAVLARRGRIELYEAALIQTAVRWERHALLAQRWLRLNAETMTHEERVRYSREIARASSERDKCLKLLGLDQEKDVWAELYAPQQPETPPLRPLAGPQSDAQAGGGQIDGGSANPAGNGRTDSQNGGLGNA